MHFEKFSLLTIKGAACLILAFAANSHFANAADLGGIPAPKRSAAPPPPPPAWQPEIIHSESPAIWTGGYVGLSAGYAWGRSEHSSAASPARSKTSPQGALGALTLGYNYQVGGTGVVVGLEGDIGIMDLNADDKIVSGGDVMRSTYGPWWSTVRGRLGYAMDRTLIYGTGGAAFIGVDETVARGGETLSNRDTRSGWVVGGGIEHAIASNMSLKVEYQHMDFGAFDGLDANNGAFSFDNKIDLVRAGVNYKF